MKLAEALILRSDMQKKYQLLLERIALNLKGQEGEKPSEDPTVLILELEALTKNTASLIEKINRTNQLTQLFPEMTLAGALTKRDSLSKLASKLHEFAKDAGYQSSRYSKSEVKEISFVDIEKLRKDADQYSEEARKLDMKIQEKNWQTELLE